MIRILETRIKDVRETEIDEGIGTEKVGVEIVA